MKDVAVQANVSTATVSRALMNPDKVSQSTRSRVEQAEIEVGYLPHYLGRNIKRSKSRTILVIVPDICDPFFSEIIRGIEVTAASQGSLVLIGDCAHQNQQEKTFIDLIITKQIDGMLLPGSRLPFDASKEEQHNLPPMVMANEFAPELELPTVHIDNLTAAFHAVYYLQELGISALPVSPDQKRFRYAIIAFRATFRRCAATASSSILTILHAATLPMKPVPLLWHSLSPCPNRQPLFSAAAMLWRWGLCLRRSVAG